jgi:hypothetical protein
MNGPEKHPSRAEAYNHFFDFYVMTEQLGEKVLILWRIHKSKPQGLKAVSIMLDLYRG